MKRRKLFFYSLLLFGFGCANIPQPNQTISQDTTSSSIKKPQKLRFAVSDVKGIEDLKKDYEALRSLLEKTLELPVEFFPVDSYIAAAAALQQDQVDLVFTGPSEYVVMRARTNALLVGGIQRDRYYPVFVTRDNSELKTIKDLKGKKIAMWEVGSTSGYLGPIKLLIDAGIDPKTDVKIELLGKKGLPALKDSEVDVWAGSIRRYDTFLEKEKAVESKFPILAQGSAFPPDPFVVNSKLDAGWVKEMQQKLFQNQEQILKAIIAADGDKFTKAKLVEVKDSDYEVIRDAYRAIGQGSFIQKN